MKLDRELFRACQKFFCMSTWMACCGRNPSSIWRSIAKYSELPTSDPAALAEWFHQGANKGSLAKYLEGFAHTIAVMQTEEALERVAYEQAEDLSKDGVVYFETRFAPVFHTRKGLTHQQVVSAVLKGLERGRKDFGISSGLIICAMRNMDVSLEMAELAVDFRERGVVGFDLAGEEGGYPPKKHVDAFHYIQRENFNITIHAGEGYGKESIWQAIQYCGAHRIGHGTRLIDDIAIARGQSGEIGRSRPVRSRQANPAGDLPDQQRPHRRHTQPGGASFQDSLSGEISRHPEHRQPADERHHHDQGIRGGGEYIWPVPG